MPPPEATGSHVTISARSPRPLRTRQARWHAVRVPRPGERSRPPSPSASPAPPQSKRYAVPFPDMIIKPLSARGSICTTFAPMAAARCRIVLSRSPRQRRIPFLISPSLPRAPCRTPPPHCPMAMSEEPAPARRARVVSLPLRQRVRPPSSLAGPPQRVVCPSSLSPPVICRTPPRGKSG
jgi:hypothetical protein